MWIRSFWSTVSNALYKSTNIAQTKLPSSRDFLKLSVKLIRARTRTIRRRDDEDNKGVSKMICKLLQYQGAPEIKV